MEPSSLPLEPTRLPFPPLANLLNPSRTRMSPDCLQFFNSDRNVTMMTLQRVSDTIAIVVVDGVCVQCFKEEIDGKHWTGMDAYPFRTDDDHRQHIQAEWITDAPLMKALCNGIQTLFEAKRALDPGNRDKFKVTRLNIIGDFSADILADFTDKLVVSEVVFYGLLKIYSIPDKVENVVHLRIRASDAEKARALFYHPAIDGAMIKQIESEKEEQFRMVLVENRPVLKPETTENILKTWIMQDAPIASYLYVYILSSLAVDQIEHVSKNMPGAKHVVNPNVTSDLRSTTFVPFGGLSNKWIRIRIYPDTAYFQVVDHNNSPSTVSQSWSEMAIQSFKRLAAFLNPVLLSRRVFYMFSAVFGYLKAAVQKRLPQLNEKD